MARAYYRAAIVEKLKADLERLAFFCQEPDQQAKGATDLATAIKQLTYWPQLRDSAPRLMLALHRTTGECHIDWVTIERAAEDVTNQARHLALAMLAIREQTFDTYSGARARKSTVQAV